HSINADSEEEEETAALLKSPLNEESALPLRCCSVRCNLAVLMFLGFAVVYGLRVNLSVAMVAMGVTFPAMMAMWARWAPPLERSRLISFSGAGSNFGAFVALPLTGFICHTLGWPAVFYCCGAAGCLWSVFWFLLVSDEPRSHPRISVQERDYITGSIGSQGRAHGWSLPLLPMLLSVPLWAIIISQMCSNWSYYTLLTSLPTYMDSVLHFDLRQNGFLSALPYLGGWLFSVGSGVVADCILERELLSITAVRKIFTLTGLLLPAAFLAAVGFVGCREYAGVLLGITNTFGTVPGVVAPIAVGYFTKDPQRPLAGWRNVFIVSAIVSAAGALVFTLFGSGKVQSWALEEDEADAKTDGPTVDSPSVTP
ncbi:sialin-like, partial [Scleropages formosus]